MFTQLSSFLLAKVREPPRTKFTLLLQLAFIKLLSAYLQNYTQISISFHLSCSYHLTALACLALELSFRFALASLSAQSLVMPSTY